MNVREYEAASTGPLQGGGAAANTDFLKGIADDCRGAPCAKTTADRAHMFIVKSSVRA